MEDRWLSVAEIAQYLGISKDTVYTWISRKNLPGNHLDRRVRNGDEMLKDASGKTAADESAYNLIMKEKEKLLSFDSKLTFIFSHSALADQKPACHGPGDPYGRRK